MREVTVKIGLKQEQDEEEIVVEMLLDSEETGLVMSKELNYAGLIVNTVEVEIYFKEHKERMSIDVIGGQKYWIYPS